MPLFKTLLGDVNLYFNDFKQFSVFLNGYYKALTDPIESPTGPVNMPLIGIDGVETSDNSLFGNRQAIIYNFLVMRNGYVKEYGNTSLIEFYNTNIDKIFSHSATFNRLYDEYKTESRILDEGLKKLSEETKQYETLLKSVEKESKEAKTLGGKVQIRILECLRRGEKLKRIIGAAHEYSIELMLLKMMTGFVRDGLGFFDEEALFEDVNYDRLLEIYKDFQSYTKKIQECFGTSCN